MNPRAGALPVKLQVRLADLVEREPYGLAGRGFEQDVAVLQPGERTFPVAAAVNGIAQGDPGLLSLKALIILRFNEFAFDAGRGDLKRIMPARNHIFDVQNSANLLRNQLAIAVGDAFGLIDRDADEAVVPAAFYLYLDHFYSLRPSDSLSDLFDFGRNCFRHRCQPVGDQQKSGLSPTALVRHSNRYCNAGEAALARVCRAGSGEDRGFRFDLGSFLVRLVG